MFNEKTILEITEKYIEELVEIGAVFYPIKVRVKSRKSTRNFGVAYYYYETKGYDVIEINQYIVEESDLRNTILHELAHLDLRARRDGHGSKWKRVAGIYGRKYGTSITRTSSKEMDVPGQIIIRVTWSDKCIRYNPHLQENNRVSEKKYSSVGYANNFIKKYKRMGFIDNYEYIRG